MHKPIVNSIKSLVAITFVILLGVDAYGQNCETLLSAGDSLGRLFESKAALQKYSDAYEKCPQSYEALMKMTRALNDLGEDVQGERSADYYQRAIAWAETLQVRYPDSVQSYFLKAAAAGNLALFRGGREKVRLSREVINNANKAIDLDSNYAPAWVIKGAYYREVATANPILKAFARSFLGGLPDGSLEDAREALSTALEIDSSNQYALYEMGQTLSAMGKKNQARDYFKKLLTLPDTHNQSAELKAEARKILKNL